MSLMEKFLSEKDLNLDNKDLQCSLGCRCCDNKGYVLEVEGFFIKARLCDCVLGCSKCHGTCRISSSSGVRSCRDKDPIAISSIFNRAFLPARFLEADLKKFKNNTGNCKEIVHEVMCWTRDYLNEKKNKGFILSGDVGVGKTYILVAVAKVLASWGKDVRFVDFHELLNMIRSGYSENKSEESFLKPLISADVLFIDELAKGRNNDWEQEKLDQLIMRRYNGNKISIYSTNYSLKKEDNVYYSQELDSDDNKFNPDVFGSLEKRIGSRIYSRLVETCELLEIQGKDYRRINAK